MKILKYRYLVFLLILFASCRKFIAVDAPITATNAENVYTSDATAAAVLTGLFAKLSNEEFTAGISIHSSLLSDELILQDVSREAYFRCYTNNLIAIRADPDFWTVLYKYIFIANAAIEGLGESRQLTPTVKQQLEGEAKFMRAYFYTYLVSFYGDVPMVLTTDYKVNTGLPRTSSKDVYKQIIKDLLEAKSLLNEEYVDADAVTARPETERVRPTKWAATALLARVYLYTGDFENAELQATEVISKVHLYQLLPLDQVFLKNNKESIWQLQITGGNYTANTAEGRIFVLPAGVYLDPGQYPVYIRPQLAESFEKGDQRRKLWLDSVIISGDIYHFASKYKIGAGPSISQEYPVVFRLAEQYLIRAEARIQQNNTSGGIDDLNELRKRATDMNGSPADRLQLLSPSIQKEEALRALEHERQVELFTEMGHRWFDLNRWPGINDISISRSDEILKAIKGNNWQATDKLLPIPAYDLIKNPALAGHQNAGY